MKSNKVKKFASDVKKGYGNLSKKYSKYAPSVKRGAETFHKHVKAISESTMDVMAPRTGFVDVRKKGVQKRMKQRSEMGPRIRGGYIDMTAKRKPIHRKLRKTKINGIAFVDLT